MVEGFRRTWRAVALAVVFALVGAGFALAMPAAINLMTRSVMPEPTLHPLPPGADPSPLYTPAAPFGLDSEGDREKAGPAVKKDRKKAAPDPVREASREEEPRRERSSQLKKPEKPKGERPERPERPDRPEKPGKPEEPGSPEDPEPAGPGEPAEDGSSDRSDDEPDEQDEPDEREDDRPESDPESSDDEDKDDGNGKGKGNSARPTREGGGSKPEKDDRRPSPDPGQPSDPGARKDKS